MNATTREIAAQAGQNIAAITYYFGSKEDLYLACAQWIADFIGEQICIPHAEETERLLTQPQPDRAAIRKLILRACRNMIKLLTQDDTVNLASLSPVSSSLPRQPITWCTNGSMPPATQPPDTPDCRLDRLRRQRYPHDPPY